jgi:hypothetical protein
MDIRTVDSLFGRLRAENKQELRMISRYYHWQVMREKKDSSHRLNLLTLYTYIYAPCAHRIHH